MIWAAVPVERNGLPFANLIPTSLRRLFPPAADSRPKFVNSVQFEVPFSRNADDPSPGGSRRIISGSSVVVEVKLAARGRCPITIAHAVVEVVPWPGTVATTVSGFWYERSL